MNRKPVFKHWTDAAKQSPSLASVLVRARTLAALDSQIRDLFPPKVGERLRLTNIRGTVVMVAVDSPGVATLVRHQRARILHVVNTKCKTPASKVTVQVQPGLAVSASS